MALGLGVNLGATQAAGINQPGGWVHEKGQQGQRLGQIKMPDVHWGGRSPIVKIKGLAFFFLKLDGVRTGDASGQNGGSIGGEPGAWGVPKWLCETNGDT